jgi:hypothetical protein
MPLYPNYQVVGGLTGTITHPGFATQLTPVGLPNFGGLVVNPFSADDQGLPEPEALFISIVRPPSQFEDEHTTKLEAGQQYIVPPGVHVWVDAVSAGHSFTSFFYSSSIAIKGSATPVPGDFPPPGPTGMTKVIPSYLYQQYTDDDDLMAFVDGQNGLQQNYVDTFNALNLPIYTSPLIKDALLDWVSEGIYGYKRPWVYAQKGFVLGPLNTWQLNERVPINSLIKTQPRGAVIADDDFFKRCLTWHYMKGDGKYFNIRWLKRRVKRFLTGVNGSCPHIDNTDDISITFGPRYECTIRFVLIDRTVIGGTLPNRFGPNGTRGGIGEGGASRWAEDQITVFNITFSTAVTYPRPAYINEFSEAINAGVLELPFQFQFQVVIG